MQPVTYFVHLPQDVASAAQADIDPAVFGQIIQLGAQIAAAAVAKKYLQAAILGLQLAALVAKQFQPDVPDPIPTPAA